MCLLALLGTILYSPGITSKKKAWTDQHLNFNFEKLFYKSENRRLDDRSNDCCLTFQTLGEISKLVDNELNNLLHALNEP